MPRRSRRLVAGGAVLLLLVLLTAGSLAGWKLAHRTTPLLPKSITSNAVFVIYFPGPDWNTPSSSANYVHDVLTLHTSKAIDSLTITQQATPEVFNDVPQYYPNLVTKLNKYTSFGTVYGTVYLTKPKELSGQQQAVLNNNGTLFFAHPNHDLSENTWHRFFNGLVILKPN